MLPVAFEAVGSRVAGPLTSNTSWKACIYTQAVMLEHPVVAGAETTAL
jgi:hypothetical protein